MGFFPILLCFSLYSAYSILLHLRPFGVIFLFLKEINLLMGLLEIKFLDNSGATSYLNFVYLKYLHNCGFALRAVPNSTVSPSLNNQITRLFNSPSKEGKEALRNKTATPSATLCSYFATLRSGRNTSAKRPSKLPYRVTSLSCGTLSEIVDFGHL